MLVEMSSMSIYMDVDYVPTTEHRNKGFICGSLWVTIKCGVHLYLAVKKTDSWLIGLYSLYREFLSRQSYFRYFT